jgi:hypothetical protein
MHSRRSRWGLGAVLRGVCATAGKGRAEYAGAAAAASAGRIDFSRDIRPILSDKCFVCHGPDAPNNKSKLRFDTRPTLSRIWGMGLLVNTKEESSISLK